MPQKSSQEVFDNLMSEIRKAIAGTYDDKTDSVRLKNTLDEYIRIKVEEFYGEDGK